MDTSTSFVGSLTENCTGSGHLCSAVTDGHQSQVGRLSPNMILCPSGVCTPNSRIPQGLSES